MVVEAAGLRALLLFRELNDMLLTAPAVGQAHGQRLLRLWSSSCQGQSILSNFRSAWLASQASKKSKYPTPECVYF